MEGRGRGGPIQIFGMRREDGSGRIDSVQQGGIIPSMLIPGMKRLLGPLPSLLLCIKGSL